MQVSENEEAHVGDPQEIKHLMQKGSGRFSTLFYIGVVIGVVLGPGLLIAVTIPAVRNALDVTNYRAMLFLVHLGRSLSPVEKCGITGSEQNPIVRR